MAFGGRGGFIGVAAANAASFVVAAVLCASPRPGQLRTAAATPDLIPGQPGSWEPLLRDCPFLGFVAVNMGLTFLAIAGRSAAPGVPRQDPGLPAWAPGTALALTAVLVTVTTPVVMAVISGGGGSAS